MKEIYSPDNQSFTIKPRGELEGEKRVTSVEEVYLAPDRGPCGGVRETFMTTDIVLDMVSDYNREQDESRRVQVFVDNPIVHNNRVMEYYQSRGLELTHDRNTIPTGSIFLETPHGTTNSLKQIALERGAVVVETECNLVTKVKNQVQKAVQEGAHIVYIGSSRKDGSLHPEARAVVTSVTENEELKEEQRKLISFVGNHDDIEKLDFKEGTPLRITAQTTLSTREYADMITHIRERFPWVEPLRSICYATDERQNAVIEIAPLVDLVCVVTSKELSHNGKMLGQRAGDVGTSYIFVEDASELSQEMFPKENGPRKVLVTSAASTSEADTIAVFNQFKSWGAHGEYIQANDDKVFVLPWGDIIAVGQHLGFDREKIVSYIKRYYPKDLPKKLFID